MRTLFVMLFMLLLASSIAIAAEPAAGEKQYYVVNMRLDMGADPTPEQQQAMVDHVAHLNTMYAAGDLFMAGPYMDEGAGVHDGLCIVWADSAGAARALVAADPSVKAGIMHITGVHQWWAAFDRPQGVTFSVEQMAAMAGEKEAAAAEHGTAQTAAAPAEHNAADMPEMALGGSNFIEYPSTDLAATQAFYGSLFGWTFDALDENFIFFSGPGGLAGGFTTMAKPTTDGPVMYINCEAIAATLARITAAGGAAKMEAMQLPMGMGYIAQFTDPSGNVLGLWSMAP